MHPRPLRTVPPFVTVHVFLRALGWSKKLGFRNGGAFLRGFITTLKKQVLARVTSIREEKKRGGHAFSEIIKFLIWD